MISFDNVWKRYTKELFKDSPPALQGVSFFLEQGQTLGLIGANGAGKSTSIRLMLDFIRPDKGEILLFGNKATDISQRHKIGYLPETASFPDNLTILDLIHFVSVTCGISKNQRKQRSEVLLKELGLWDAKSRLLRTYSKGMLQRASFVLALLNDPLLLILDEPMSGLDPLGRQHITELILKLKNQGKTILFCSHILSDVDKLVDQLLILHNGVSLFNGYPSELLAQQKENDIESAFISLVKKKQHNNV